MSTPKKLMDMKKYLVEYQGDGYGGARKFHIYDEAFRGYGEVLKTWLQDITVPRNDKEVQVVVIFGYPEFATALRSAREQQVKPEINRELNEYLVDLRDDKTRVPIVSFYPSNTTYDQAREIPGEMFYKGNFVDASKKDIIILNKEVPFILQWTISIWTKYKSDMAFIRQQLLNRFNPNVVFLVENQEIPCRLDSITDTSVLEAKDGTAQLVRNEVVISMDAWIKRDPASVRTVIKEKMVFYEEAYNTDDPIKLLNILNKGV
jgi:hypothetical protein